MVIGLWAAPRDVLRILEEEKTATPFVLLFAEIQTPPRRRATRAQYPQRLDTDALIAIVGNSRVSPASLAGEKGSWATLNAARERT